MAYIVHFGQFDADGTGETVMLFDSKPTKDEIDDVTPYRYTVVDVLKVSDNPWPGSLPLEYILRRA